MSISRFLLFGATLVVALVLAPNANAQQYTPFFDNWEFGHDFQPFAPVINEEYGYEPIPPNTGWFFAFDRVYLNVTRGAAADQSFNGDFTWGNRIELGYMTEEDHGWLLSAWELDGPTVGAPDETTPASNVGAFGGVELNKTWRCDPLHDGSIFEPFVGVRFLKFDDKTFGLVENHMIGGQLGARWYKQKGNFLLSGEVRGFPAHNYQFFPDASREEFVIAGEVRFEVAYLLSREVALRFGWDTLYFGRGIARDATFNTPNDEDMLVTGLSMGITVNR